MTSAYQLKNSFAHNIQITRSSNLAEKAANALREMILLEQLTPGTLLSERDLSEALGISRTPLREAIRILAHEALIEFTPSRRPRVANPTIDEISEYLRVQGALEALAGELVCQVATDQELLSIQHLNDTMNKYANKEDPLTSFKRDMNFHTSIVSLSQNKPLAQTHSSYNGRLWRARFLSSQRKEGKENTALEHQNIVSALMQRNQQKAKQALTQHLATAVTNIKKALKERSQTLSQDT